jgi:radical SAM superfamily enzyme YgiQ (UPF0313 family)
MTKARVLIVQPPSPPGLNVKRDLAGGFAVANKTTRATYGHDPSYPTMPHLSLLYLASLLERDDHPVAFVDGGAQQLDEHGMDQAVASFRPDVVVYLVNLPSLYGDCDLARTLKQRYPEIRFIGAGVVCRALDEEILKRGEFDYVCRGDIEVIVPDLLRGFENEKWPAIKGTSVLQDGRLVQHPEIPRLTDLAHLPWPAYHLAPMDRYWYQVFGEGRSYATVQASKGCPYTCYYCPYPYGFGHKLLQRTPKDIVDECEYLKTKFKVEAIYFRDQVFSLNRRVTIQLCEEILKRKLKFEWVVETRLDSVDGEMLRLMKKAGCRRIHFGLETGDPEAFQGGGKDHAKGTVQELSRRMRMTEASGIAAHAFILVGLLGESWDTIRHTSQLISEVKPTTLQVAIITPYPGTDMFIRAEERGLLLTRDWSQYTGFDPVMRTEYMSAEDLVAAQDMLIHHHAQAVRWERAKALTIRTARYIADGSLPRRVLKRFGPRSLRRRLRAHA